MKQKVKIIVYTTDNKFLNFLINKNILYKSLEKYNNYFTLVCNINDYKKIRIFYKSKIIKYYGKDFIKYFFYKQKYILISLFISLLILNGLSNTIFDIKINTDDNELKNNILESLEKNNIKKYKKKKNFKEIEIIKKNILEDNKDHLEWLEIVNKGCNYIINVTPRVMNKKEENKNINNIVASKDGLIKHINSISGTKQKEIGDYVKKGDILISSNIIKNDKVVDQINAQGTVFAETWYTVKVSIPYNYKKYIHTGKIINHYYLDIFGHKFSLIGKYDSNKTRNTKKLILEKPYLFFKLYKEIKKEYEYKEYRLSEAEALKEAINKSEEKIKETLDSNEYIISKNVLKKESFSSKMEIEVFYKVYESIASTSKIKDILGENNGASN